VGRWAIVSMLAVALLGAGAAEARPATPRSASAPRKAHKPAARPAPKRLQTKAVYKKSLSKASQALRKRGAKSVVRLKRDIPTIVIPDIHARTGYLSAVLKQRDPATKKTYAQLLRAKKIQIVAVGDGMHSEGRSAARWLQAEARPNGSAMRAEMGESLGTMKQIMDFKAAYPDNFHYIKGNHDNITNRNRGGDWAVVKYTNVGEGKLVKDFVTKNYGKDFLKKWDTFERSLPLVTVGKGFAVSHSGPEKALKPVQIAKRTGRVVENFTWTDLTTQSKRQARSAAKQLEYFGEKGGVYLAGHRETTGKRAYRQQGRFFQVNSEEKMHYVVMDPNKSFDPKRDVRAAK
jgi:hypothetical protein